MFQLRIILLSAFLLLCQSGLLLHELSTDHSGITHASCDACLSENGLDGGLGLDDTSLQISVWGRHNEPTHAAAFILPNTNTDYQSRAPPRA